MRFPWANVVLLLLLLMQLITGYFGFTNGRAAGAWLLWLHGAGAYAIVLLLLWKGAIVWDVLSRGKRWTWARVSFLLMAVLLLATLLLGLLWTFGGPRYLFGFSLVSLHIYVAIPLMLLLAFHAWRMRWILRVRQAVGRRTFLRAGLLGLVGAAAWWVGRRFQGERRFTGSYEVGSFGGRFPYVSWINDNPRPIAPDDWQLTIEGLVQQPVQLDYDALLQRVGEEVTATLDCTGGWYSRQEWRGVNVGRLLAEAGPRPAVRSVAVRSVTGYWRRFSLEEAKGCLLATHVAGAVLEHGHGFPARLVVPGRRGFNWVKWVTLVRLESVSPLWQPPLPLQ